eukprot:TRINITY_DN27439_c0_g1_i1.p1 TRINITY_DN27439_c0_g1~~TRINITY_DN27439_c0_g1_i1.p1  ORF type:complete len:126 (+),score=9.82 TRINITY_DN27439_c0_g1_i1:150-527(+)
MGHVLAHPSYPPLFLSNPLHTPSASPIMSPAISLCVFAPTGVGALTFTVNHLPLKEENKNKTKQNQKNHSRPLVKKERKKQTTTTRHSPYTAGLVIIEGYLLFPWERMLSLHTPNHVQQSCVASK